MQLTPKQGKLYRAIKPGEHWTYDPRGNDKGDDSNWCFMTDYDVGCLMLFLGIREESYRHCYIFEFLSPVGVVCRTYFKDNDEFERWFEPAET